jgi:hypothetical protein
MSLRLGRRSREFDSHHSDVDEFSRFTERVGVTLSRWGVSPLADNE